MTAQPPLVQEQRQPAITWRSMTLGLGGVIFICGLTPYNDYALNNTFLVGNNLPIGVVMAMFLFILLVNGPLHRWAPRYALSAGEITVAFSMSLVSCALPGSGLMRYLPPSLVAPFWLAQGNADYLGLLEAADPPSWLFPDFSGDGPRQWMNDPIVTGYIFRWTEDGPPPYLAWVQPAATWGIFLAALFGALLCMVVIVRRQWIENERLPFPLAQIYLSLIEPPPRGRMLNTILARWPFWIAFGTVFALHAWNGLFQYYPEYFPQIPVYYDLNDLFSEPPWEYVDQKIKDAAVFFTVVGVTYFLSSSVAFSLWFFYILHNLHRMWLGTMTGDPHVHGMFDQHFGGLLAFALVVLWVGRSHWRLVAAQAFRGERPGEAAGRYLPYPLAFWGFIACAAVMTGWLWMAGATLPAAAVTVLLLLLGFFIITRIIAETGLVHGQIYLPLFKPWQMLAFYGVQQPVPLKSFFLAGHVESHHFDFREPMPVYASHGVRVADQTIYSGREAIDQTAAERTTGRRLILLLAVALLVGYIVSFASTLWTNYNHAWTQDVSARMPINDWGTQISPQWKFLDPSTNYQHDRHHAAHSPAGNTAFGLLFTAILGFLRLHFTWWPLHPIGFLMVGTFPGSHLWFSIMIGWLCKTLIVRFGGASLFTSAKPFFIGLIVGESAAAGFWLAIGILLSTLDIPYRPVHIMPG